MLLKYCDTLKIFAQIFKSVNKITIYLTVLTKYFNKYLIDLLYIYDRHWLATLTKFQLLTGLIIARFSVYTVKIIMWRP